ncbi:hypothetical protein Tco_0500943, partial [Tanacetum coccineum]
MAKVSSKGHDNSSMEEPWLPESAKTSSSVIVSDVESLCSTHSDNYQHLTFCNIWDLIITGSLPSAFEYMQIDAEIGHTGKTIHLEVKISDTNCFFLKRSYDVPGSSHILDSPLLLIQFLPFLHTIAGVLLLLPLSNITVAPTQMTPMSMTESFTLPPLSSLLAGSAPRSSSGLLILKPTLNLDEIPPFLPEPLVRLPLSMPTSQQILIFTPLMTDPIVHIPVMDICSSESRDTPRLLISGSSQLPSVLANVDGKQNLCAAGSRGLYEGATDLNHAIANSIASMSLTSSKVEYHVAILEFWAIEPAYQESFAHCLEDDVHDIADHCLRKESPDAIVKAEVFFLSVR